MGVSISIFSYFFCLSIFTVGGQGGRLSFSFAFSGNGVCKKKTSSRGVFFWVGKSRVVWYTKIYHVLQNPSLVFYTA